MLLEAAGLAIVAGSILWGSLKWIATKPNLLTGVDPCRGGWAEGRLRGCHQGIAFTGVPVEPINTLSTPVYLAVGWVTFRTLQAPPAIAFAVAMAFLCAGSGLYHGTKSLWASSLDHGGMYAVFATLACYALVPGHPAIVWFMAAFAVVWGMTFVFLFPGNLNGRMALLLTLVSSRGFLAGTWTLALVSLALMALAVAAWTLDRRTRRLGRFGHAIWHVLTAGALATMFLAMA